MQADAASSVGHLLKDDSIWREHALDAVALTPEMFEALVPDASLCLGTVAPEAARAASWLGWPTSLIIHIAAVVILIGLVSAQSSSLPTGGEVAIPVELLIAAPETVASTEAAPAAEAALPVLNDLATDPVPTTASPNARRDLLADQSETDPGEAPAPIVEDVVPKSDVRDDAKQVVPPEVQPPEPVLIASLPPTVSAPDSVEPVVVHEPQLPALPPDPIPELVQPLPKARAIPEPEVKRPETPYPKPVVRSPKQLQPAKPRDETASRRRTARLTDETATELRKPRAVEAAAVTEAGQGRARTSRQEAVAGGTRGAATSAGAAQVASWRAQVIAHLARFKRYPAAAEEREITGRSGLIFTLSKSGQVLGVSLAGSSGHSILDQEALAMVRRAAPFPAAPAGTPATHSFTTAVRFDMR
jgi:protein TonB